MQARSPADELPGRDALLQSSRDHDAIRRREPGQRPVVTADVSFPPLATLRRPIVVAAADLTDPSEHAKNLVELWRNGAELHASCASASEVERYGVRGLEEVVDETPGTNQLRLTAEDPRLAAEIALASGFRSLHGAGVAGAAAAAADQGPAANAKVQDWQYVDQLVGWYESRGVPVQRSYPAPLPGVSCPPAVMCACLVLDALVGAEAGVRHHVLELNENLHLQQDVAALRLLPRLARSHLQHRGHEGVSVAATLKIWSGQWPEPEPDAFGLLGFAVLTASLGGASAVIIHSDGDGEIERAAKRVRFARSTLVVSGSQRYPDSDAIAALEALIAREAHAMIDAVLARDTGDLRAAVALAFELGIVELPPSTAEPSLPPSRVRNAFVAEGARSA